MLLNIVLAVFIHPLVWWAMIFFGMAIIAYIIGVREVAGMSPGIGKVLLFVLLLLASLFAIIGFLNSH